MTNGHEYYVVELPSEYLNNSAPQVVASEETREEAKSEMYRKIDFLDLHGSDYTILGEGAAEVVEVQVAEEKLEMFLTVCSICKSALLTTKADRQTCPECDAGTTDWFDIGTD